MKSKLADLSQCGIAPFVFAGQQWPKHLWTLPRGTKSERLKDRQSGCTGDYYHAPLPILTRYDRREIGKEGSHVRFEAR